MLSTHDLTRRSTGLSTEYCVVLDLSTHDLTRRSTWAGVSEDEFNALSTHDLTRRSTWCSVKTTVRKCSFNSRPHKEVDCEWAEYPTKVLDFQLTTSQGGRLPCQPFSTAGKPFNSRPHKEVDEKQVTEVDSPQIFQLTTSQGGRQLFPHAIHRLSDLSTHDLTRRSTANLYNKT